MAPPELPTNLPDNRIEPGILTDLVLEDDTRNPAEPTSHRLLSVTLLVSVLAHVVLLLMAAYAADRDTRQTGRPVARPSIQIRFQPPPPPPVEAAAETVTETVTETITENVAETRAQPPANNPSPAPTDERMPSESATETIAETPPDAPQVRLPSLTDLRTAARDRAEQDRRDRVTHPDCLRPERRNAYLDCDGEQAYDFASAGQNATVLFFTPSLPTEPAESDEPLTATGARVRAAIDMVDNQLGTTQTKKRIMNFP